MKRVRDILIIIVLGAVVVWFIVGFIDKMREASLNNSTVVRQAESACIEDGMTCSFTSEASAETYLKSAAHLAKVKARQEKKEKDDRYTDCAAKAKGRKHLQDCDQLK